MFVVIHNGVGFRLILLPLHLPSQEDQNKGYADLMGRISFLHAPTAQTVTQLPSTSLQLASPKSSNPTRRGLLTQQVQLSRLKLDIVRIFISCILKISEAPYSVKPDWLRLILQSDPLQTYFIHCEAPCFFGEYGVPGQHQLLNATSGIRSFGNTEGAQAVRARGLSSIPTTRRLLHLKGLSLI